MKYLYITYYFPPDLGAGSFRSKSLIQNLAKKIKKKDEIHIITTKPNRYSSQKKRKWRNKKNIFIHEIKLFSHGEKFLLKSLSGIIYLYKGILLTIKIKPNFIITSSARLISGLIGFVGSKIYNIKYMLDLRDLFSSFVENYSEKKKFIKIFLPLFSYLEKLVIQNSVSVNLVSAGFYSYFKKKKLIIKNFTNFTNGVDELFLKSKVKKIINKKKIILYAGNIGLGQGLEKIIPGLAKINKKFQFIIIGSGGTSETLKHENSILKNKNVRFLNPVDRKKLINFYQKSDILFLHLNNLETFKYNLPSKIYEYSVLGKPVLAGIEGYAKKYCKQNFDNFFFFKPGNIKDCNKKIDQILKNKWKFKANKKLIRNDIMNNYANHIIEVSKKKF